MELWKCSLTELINYLIFLPLIFFSTRKQEFKSFCFSGNSVQIFPVVCKRCCVCAHIKIMKNKSRMQPKEQTCVALLYYNRKFNLLSNPIWQLFFEVVFPFSNLLSLQHTPVFDLIAKTQRKPQHIFWLIFMCEPVFPLNQIGWKECVWYIGSLMNL